MKGKFDRPVVYVLLFCFCFILFLYYTFPYDRLKVFLLQHITKNRSYNVESIELKTLSPSWFTGFKFEGLKLVKSSMMGLSSQEVRIDSGSLRVGFFSLMKILSGFRFSGESLTKSIQKNLELKFQFSGYGGGASGYVDLSELQLIKVEAGKLDLEKMDFLRGVFGGGSISGTIKAIGLNIRVPRGRLNDMSGNIICNLENGSFSGIKVSFVSLPDIKVSTFKVNLRAKSGNIVIKEFTITGDIEGKVSGTIKLEPDLMFSKMNLNLNLKLAEELIKDFSPILNAFVEPDSSGNYNFKLMGTLSSPEFKKR